ncbi:MAG TPA: heparan-alpha-glucosaminide N-acetyltransferase domain-containing protein, partial [Vicinamibacterales bacterium]
MQSKGEVTGLSRRNYLDWMRGLAVLIMIEAHVVDAWTRMSDRGGIGFRNAIILGGFGAPLFLFLAGVAVVLAAESRQQRFGSPERAAAATRRRGWEIFGLSFLFRLQAYLLSPGATLWG